MMRKQSGVCGVGFVVVTPDVIAALPASARGGWRGGRGGWGGGGGGGGWVGVRTISSAATLFFSVIGDATSRKAGAAATSMSSFGSMIALGDPLQVEQIGPFRTLMARYGGAGRHRQIGRAHV